jgi:hypothetical protein
VDELVPSEFYLGQNYPNPFKEKTIIKYCIAYKTRVKLIVYSSEREEIIKLVDEEKNPGTYEVIFQSTVGSLPDGLSANKAGKAGRQLVSGNYYYRLKAGDYSSEKKMVIKNEEH